MPGVVAASGSPAAALRQARSLVRTTQGDQHQDTRPHSGPAHAPEDRHRAEPRPLRCRPTEVRPTCPGCWRGRFAGANLKKAMNPALTGRPSARRGELSRPYRAAPWVRHDPGLRPAPSLGTCPGLYRAAPLGLAARPHARASRGRGALRRGFASFDDRSRSPGHAPRGRRARKAREKYPPNALNRSIARTAAGEPLRDVQPSPAAPGACQHRNGLRRAASPLTGHGRRAMISMSMQRPPTGASPDAAESDHEILVLTDARRPGGRSAGRAR